MEEFEKKEKEKDERRKKERAAAVQPGASPPMTIVKAPEQTPPAQVETKHELETGKSSSDPYPPLMVGGEIF